MGRNEPSGSGVSSHVRRLLGLLLVVAAACSGGGSDLVPSTTTTEAALTLDAFAAKVPGFVAHSPSGPTAVVVAGADRSTRVLVVHPAGRTWATVATLALPPPSFTFGQRPIEVDDITGDDEDDFLVPLEAGSASIGVVVSNDGGRGWRFLGGVGMDGPYFARSPRIEGGRLVTIDNDCVPSCAAGTNTPVAWRYADDQFVRVP